MDYKKLSDAIRRCGSTPKIHECKEKCPYYAGGDMTKCIPVMTKDAADAIENLLKENEMQKKTPTLGEALSTVAWYDGYTEWLWDIADKLQSIKDGEHLCTWDVGLDDTEQWHTEKHVIWMLLVSAFGDWGTSVRSGWIDKPKECAEYINLFTDRYGYCGHVIREQKDSEELE